MNDAASPVLKAAAWSVVGKPSAHESAELHVLGQATYTDDIPEVQITNPPLTTVAQPKFRLGELACRLLCERLADRSLPPRRRLLDVQLILRQTTAPPPNGARRLRES